MAPRKRKLTAKAAEWLEEENKRRAHGSEDEDEGSEEEKPAKADDEDSEPISDDADDDVEDDASDGEGGKKGKKAAGKPKGRAPAPAPKKFTKAQAAAYVDRTVGSSPVVVFAKTFCPHCKRAKEALQSVIGNSKFKVVELDEMPNEMDAIQDALLDLTGARSVPRVFVGGKFIGGADDTARLAENGELKEILEDAGVATRD